LAEFGALWCAFTLGARNRKRSSQALLGLTVRLDKQLGKLGKLGKL
jgi:hypothetical protein